MAGWVSLEKGTALVMGNCQIDTAVTRKGSLSGQIAQIRLVCWPIMRNSCLLINGGGPRLLQAAPFPVHVVLECVRKLAS